MNKRMKAFILVLLLIIQLPLMYAIFNMVYYHPKTFISILYFEKMSFAVNRDIFIIMMLYWLFDLIGGIWVKFKYDINILRCFLFFQALWLLFVLLLIVFGLLEFR